MCSDRLREKTLDEAGVIGKFGVTPTSIPDWLALVGDSADGYPGLPRWGRLFRTLATLRTDVPLTESLDDLRWRGPRRSGLVRLCAEIGDDGFAASI